MSDIDLQHLALYQPVPGAHWVQVCGFGRTGGQGPMCWTTVCSTTPAGCPDALVGSVEGAAVTVPVSGIDDVWAIVHRCVVHVVGFAGLALAKSPGPELWD